MLSSTRIKKEEPSDVFYDSMHSMTPSPQNNQQPLKPQISSPISGSIEQALLKPSIYDKCQALTAALKDNNNFRELQRQFPVIVQKIFGFGQYPPGWQVELLHRNRSRRDSDAVLAFLHPNGPLFINLIYKLMAEEVAFEFPYTSIPEATRRKIDEGFPVSELYTNKFSMSPQPILVLDPFEFYFFVFIHKMTDSTTKSQGLYLEPSEWVYPTLLNDYMQYFLPMTGLPQSPPYVPLSTLNRSHQQPATPQRAPSQPRRQGLGLLKQTPKFSRSLSVQQSTPGDGNMESDVMWRSEKIIQIITEFWMGQTSLDMPSQPSMSYDRMGTEYLPSHDLIMLVRMFVKHIHAFIHSSQGNVLPSHQQNPNTLLGAIKRNMLPRYIQKPLYGFLKHSIEKWPLDTSFRPILETWLTYIRPWRYACSPNESRPSTGDDESNTIDFRLWEGFVKANSLFYSVLFQDILIRFLRIDLTSSKMSYQLSRVTKVFDRPDLISILRDIDMSLMSRPYGFQEYNDTSYSDVTSGAMGSAHHTLATQISDLEAANFSYRPMFCDEVTTQVHNLLQEMVNAQFKVRKLLKKSQEKQKSTQNTSILSFMGLGDMMEFNEAQSGDTNKEYVSTDRWLEQSITELCAIFRVQAPDCDCSTSSDLTSTGSTSDTIPDHKVKPDGSVELTDLGRYQVLNGLRRFTNIEYRGDPELQPVRSFESDIGVIQLYKLSTALNNKYGAWFEEQYNKDGLIGCIARRLLNMPPVTRDDHLHPSTRKPRLSLRMLANYYILGYSLVGYLVMSTILGKLPTMTLTVLSLVFYIIIVSLIDLMRGKHD